MTRFTKVEKVRSVRRAGIALEIGGKRIALFNFEGEFMAIEATCAQHRGPLERGVIDEGRLRGLSPAAICASTSRSRSGAWLSAL
jgi:nitrite reductase/ring-hydroxylating ferredoxin subunit